LKRSKALLENKIVRKQLPFLLLGMLIAISLSHSTPLFPSVVFFLLSIVALLVFVVIFALGRDFMRLRILFLGASITSVALAFRTFFFSIVLNGLVQIPFDALVSLFRSILLTSFFSLLERLTRFIEDQLETKTAKA
jgi:hypothetical protein